MSVNFTTISVKEFCPFQTQGRIQISVLRLDLFCSSFVGVKLTNLYVEIGHMTREIKVLAAKHNSVIHGTHLLGED